LKVEQKLKMDILQKQQPIIKRWKSKEKKKEKE